MSQRNPSNTRLQVWEPVPHDWLDSIPVPPPPPGLARLLMAFLVAGLFIIPTLAVIPIALSAGTTEAKKLDLEAKAKPLIIEGTGNFDDEESNYWMTVAGTRLNLTESFYYGLTADANVTSSIQTLYFLAAYLPTTKQVIEAQVYDVKGGKLLALFADTPDPQTGYKSALYDRYPLNNNIWLLYIYIPVALLMIWIGVHFGRRYYRGHRSSK